jgi:WD40 repeat protein
LQISNISRVGPINRKDGISVIRMDWIEDGNFLIDAGSNAVSFIDAKSMAVSQKVQLDGAIPLSIAAAGDRIYILLNNGISNYGGWAVVFSPDSQYIVSGTSQGILRWETATGTWRITPGGQDKAVKTLAYSHNGRIIAGGGDGFIYFWDAEGGELLHQIEERIGVITSLDFSPDDSMVVSGGTDAIVRIWDVNAAAQLKELPGHGGPISGVCFSPDGQYIASGAQLEANIRIWGLP